MAAHVRRAALPSPGGEAELEDWAAEFWSHRLERTRPLWEMVLLEGLEGGRWALVTKTHHCMVDGVGSVDVAHLLLDAEPDPAPGERVAPAPVATDGRGGPGGIPGALLHGARAGADVVLHPSSLLDATQRARALSELLLRNEVRAAPHTSLNGPIGKYRRFAVAEASLDELKQVKGALGGTVNDVVLAAATGGLRALLDARGETPPREGMRAMVPVNVRSAAELARAGQPHQLAVRPPPGRRAASPDALRAGAGRRRGPQGLQPGARRIDPRRPGRPDAARVASRSWRRPCSPRGSST